MTTWIKVFNSMPSNPKLMKAGERASWLFLCGLCYSNEHLTDGFIAEHVLPIVAPGVRNASGLAARLVLADLWTRVDNGWQIHDYAEHQRTAREIREYRAKDALRKKSERSPNGQISDSVKSPKHNSESVQAVRVEKTREEKTTPPTEEARKRATRRIDQSIPPDGMPAELLPIVDAVLEILVDVYGARGGVEPQPRGVGLAILRNPRADHVQVARKLEHWLMAGRGQRSRCADITARFGDWVAEEAAGKPLTVMAGRRESASELISAIRGEQ